MKILDNDMIVEFEKGAAQSFNRKYKNFIGMDGNAYSLDIKEVKKDVLDYLIGHRNQIADKKIFSFIYDLDMGIGITVVKNNPNYEVYTIVACSSLDLPEETYEDDEEKAETKKQLEILKQNEKINAKRLSNIIERLDG